MAALLAIGGLAAIPLILLALRSLAQAWYWPALSPPAWSVRAWRYIFSGAADVLPALGASSVIALTVTLLAVAVALPAARVLAWQEFRGKHAALFALLAPALTPPLAATMGAHALFLRYGLTDTTLGVVLILLMWIAWNFPTRVDIEWLKAGGGIVGHEHPPARRFNAGQKMIYWIVVLGGGAVAATGYLLMFPFYATDIAGMQLAQMVHGVVALLFVAAMLGHIYIGTIGMEGAFEAMGSGTVDTNWAKQHHSLWLADKEAKGQIKGGAPPAAGHMQPAE